MNDLSLDDLLNYYRNKVKELATDFTIQEKKAIELGLYDYYTEDIANDWTPDDYAGLYILQKNGLISSLAIELYKEIDKNFELASIGGPKYSPIIWTLEGMEKNVFWIEQRKLASLLLTELLNSKSIHKQYIKS